MILTTDLKRAVRAYVDSAGEELGFVALQAAVAAHQRLDDGVFYLPEARWCVDDEERLQSEAGELWEEQALLIEAASDAYDAGAPTLPSRLPAWDDPYPWAALASGLLPREAYARITLGTAKVRAGDPDGARQTYQAVVEQEHYHPSSYLADRGLVMVTEVTEGIEAALRLACDSIPRHGPSASHSLLILGLALSQGALEEACYAAEQLAHHPGKIAKTLRRYLQRHVELGLVADENCAVLLDSLLQWSAQNGREPSSSVSDHAADSTPQLAS